MSSTQHDDTLDLDVILAPREDIPVRRQLLHHNPPSDHLAPLTDPPGHHDSSPSAVVARLPQHAPTG